MRYEEKEFVMIPNFPRSTPPSISIAKKPLPPTSTNSVSEDDSDLFLSALSDIARAGSLSRVAEDSGLGRESIYKALRPGAKPEFVTISKLMGALRVRVVAKPLKPETKSRARA